jgi:hypothetical protein
MVGEAGWQTEEIESWRAKLCTSQALQKMGVEVLSAMPFSQTIVRGKWRWGKIPQRFHPMLDEIVNMIFTHPSWRSPDPYDEEPWHRAFIDMDESITFLNRD